MRIAADHLFTGYEETAAGRIVIENGRIVETLPPGESDIDLGSTLICSGLINSHVHLDLSLPRETDQVPGEFADWLKGVVDTRRQLGPTGLTEVAVRGVEESLREGTTAVFDIDPEGHSLEALEHSDLKRILFREVISLDGNLQDLDQLQKFLSGTQDQHRELRAISPHSPYTVHPTAMSTLLEQARDHQTPWAIHVAEPEWEAQLLTSATGPGADFLKRFSADPREWKLGKRFLEALSRNEQLSASGLIIHGNHCTPEEFDSMASTGAALVWCPSSHAYFGHPPHPAPDALERGVNVLLGTDGKISAGHLSMLKELQSARQAAPKISAVDLWSMITIQPRAWLARQQRTDWLGTGRLQPGDPADLVAISVKNSHGSVLESAIHGSIQACWIDGRIVNSSAPPTHPADI